MQYVLELVEQFLGAAQAECRDEDGALVCQGTIDGIFQTLPAVAAMRMQAVTIGAFQHQYVSTLRGPHRAQQWVATSAQVTGEHVPGIGLPMLNVALHIG
ncbi:hypothetical protein D3C76_722500 [compost metagenome]